LERLQSKPSFNHSPQLIDHNARLGRESLIVSHFIQIARRRDVLGAVPKPYFKPSNHEEIEVQDSGSRHALQSLAHSPAPFQNTLCDNHPSTPCPTFSKLYHLCVSNMSGLEVVAGVAGIVSAVVSVFNLVKKAAASRKAKKLAIQANVQTAESQLVTTLQGSPNQIYEELHKNLGRAGAAFGRGDGTLMKSSSYF
jgi:hypothetical protein